jgi:lipopolysaccharide export LptBFGC system permease protein LptF
VLSLAVFALNELWVPQSSDRADRILFRRVQTENMPRQGLLPTSGLANLREGRTWLAGEYNQKTSEMRDPQIIWSLPDGSQRWLFATRAIRTNGVWTFFNVSECRTAGGSGSMLAPFMQTNVLAMPEFKETPEEILSEVNISKGLSLRFKNKAELPIAQIRDYLRLHPNPPDSLKPRLYTELHARLATPWTCLVVVVIAIPFGVASGRKNVFVGVAGGIFICLVYVVVQRFTLALGIGGKIPPWVAAWSPNLSFGLAGLWMTAKVR